MSARLVGVLSRLSLFAQAIYWLISREATEGAYWVPCASHAGTLEEQSAELAALVARRWGATRGERRLLPGIAAELLSASVVVLHADRVELPQSGGAGLGRPRRPRAAPAPSANEQRTSNEAERTSNEAATKLHEAETKEDATTRNDSIPDPSRTRVATKQSESSFASSDSESARDANAIGAREALDLLRSESGGRVDLRLTPDLLGALQATLDAFAAVRPLRSELAAWARLAKAGRDSWWTSGDYTQHHVLGRLIASDDGTRRFEARGLSLCLERAARLEAREAAEARRASAATPKPAAKGPPPTVEAVRAARARIREQGGES